MAQDRRVFLERRSYQRRRLVDAARMLPLFGLALWLVPLLWPAQPGPEDTQGISIAAASFYIFGVWALLIGLASGLARTVPDAPDEPSAAGADPRRAKDASSPRSQDSMPR